MNLLLRFLPGLALAVAALLTATGCCTSRSKMAAASNRPHYAKSFTIVQQPQSRTAQANSFVVFAVRVHPEHSATYQWRFNGSPINGATNRECFVRNASVANVGSYSVEVGWPVGKIYSNEAFLSVYSVREANGIAGTMVVPIKAFKNASQFECDTEAAITIDKEYTPGEAEGTRFSFYGPEVPLGEQVGPFLNWTHLSNLRIDGATSTSTGGQRPSAIRFTENFNLNNPKNLGCDTDSGPDRPTVVRTNLSASPDPKKARYGVTIYKGGATPNNGTVAFSWLYY